MPGKEIKGRSPRAMYSNGKLVGGQKKLDKNKDGKISKEDFEMLRKEKKESKSMMHKDEDKDNKKKKIKPKMSYAQTLIYLTEKFGLGNKPSCADFKKSKD